MNSTNTQEIYQKVSDFVDNLSKPGEKNFGEKTRFEAIEEFIASNQLASEQGCQVIVEKLNASIKNDEKASVAAYILSLHLSKIPSFRPVLEKWIKDSQVSDFVRKKLIQVIASQPSNNQIKEFMPYFHNKEAIAEDALKSLLSHSKDSQKLAEIESFLKQQGNDFHRVLIGNLTHRSDEESIHLLEKLVYWLPGEISYAAIQALGYKKSPIAYQALTKLSQTQPDEKQQQLISQSLQRLERYQRKN